jgi:hypothetical protein
MTWRAHVIRQGEYLELLAHRLGFDADEVWNDEQNRELREKRADRNVLAPGDVLHVPAQERARARLSPGTTNRYRGRVPTVPVRLNLGGPNAPLANEPYIARGFGPEVTGTSDAEGLVTLAVPITTAEVQLELPRQGYSVRLRLGHLDPVDRSSSVEARLTNLGYFFPLAAADHSSREERLARALRRFQRDQRLPATGEIDDATARALLARHGS